MFSFLTNKLYGIYEKMKGITVLDESTLTPFFAMIKNNLIEADVALDVIEKIIENLKKRIFGVKISKNILAGEYLAKEFYTVILHLLQSNQNNSKKEFLYHFINESKQSKKPFLIFLVGLQGAGKTTTAAKIIHLILEYKKQTHIQSKDLGVISLDYDRPAAAEQLKLVAESCGIDYIKTDKTKDAISAANILKESCQKNEMQKKIIIVDTAGRLSIDTAMMKELKEVYTILKPKEIFLIIDTMISQEGINVARSFSETVPCSGCIITKVDSEAPGGIILGVTSLLSLPILYLTFGEKPSDIKQFDPVIATKKLIGMGEIVSLMKSAEAKMAKEEEKILEDAFKRGDITVDEFTKIINVLGKMGPLKHIFSMIPRSMIGGMEVDNSTFSQIEIFHKTIMVLACSMTKKEKNVPTLLLNNNQRIKRISKGSGISVQQVEQSLNLFFKMRTGFNQFKNFVK